MITFGAAIIALLLIAPIPPAHGAVRPSVAAIAEGLRFARRRRAILGTFVVDLNAMVFGMPTALFPVLALDVFRVGPAGLGALAAAPAVGALIGALLTGWVGRVRRTGRAVLWASAGWGLAITAFGLSTFSFQLALVFLAAAGAADVITAVLRSAIVELLTPDELRGRVTSIHILVVTGGPRLGDVEATAVASLAGAQLSVVSGGLLCRSGLAGIIRSFPELAAFDMWQVAAAGSAGPTSPAVQPRVPHPRPDAGPTEPSAARSVDPETTSGTTRTGRYCCAMPIGSAVRSRPIVQLCQLLLGVTFVLGMGLAPGAARAASPRTADALPIAAGGNLGGTGRTGRAGGAGGPVAAIPPGTGVAGA